ncbi:MAG: hypothetical protein AABN95_22655 [Acidobacteriota bacterium]
MVTLDVQEPVIFGLSVLGTLRVTNRGATSVTISSRLNLMEGDVRLTVFGPDTSPRELRGWQADTILRQATLAPNEQLVGSMNLLQTEAGPVFPTPGRYQLQAEFSPSPRDAPVTSPRIDVDVRSPQTDAERGAAELLANEVVRQSIVLAQSDAAPNEIAQLAKKFPETLDGKLARLILAGTSDAANRTHFTSLDSSLLDVPLISALRTPFSRVGRQLAEDFTRKIQTLNAKQGAQQANLDSALRIVEGKPMKAS